MFIPEVLVNVMPLQNKTKHCDDSVTLMQSGYQNMTKQVVVKCIAKVLLCHAVRWKQYDVMQEQFSHIGKMRTNLWSSTADSYRVITKRSEEEVSCRLVLTFHDVSATTDWKFSFITRCLYKFKIRIQNPCGCTNVAELVECLYWHITHYNLLWEIKAAHFCCIRCIK